MKKRKLSSRSRNLLIGVTIGLVLILAATLYELSTHHLSWSWEAFVSIHKNPLMWIIDAQPILLGFFALQTGNKQQGLVEDSSSLEEIIDQRSSEIIHQKLFYEALVDNSPIAIVTLDQDHKIISINPAFQELFGFRHDEIAGQDLDSLIGNPDNPDEAYRITQDVWQGKAIHEFGKRKRKDGSLVDVEILGEQIKVKGKRIGVLGLYRDITIEKQSQEALSASEERFRRMFSDSPVALRMEDYSEIKKWIDKNIGQGHSLANYFNRQPQQLWQVASLARIVDLNDSTLFLFGANNKEELQNMLDGLLSEESRNDALNIIDALLKGETIMEKELVYRRLDGRKIYTITKLSVMPGFEKDWGRVLFSNMDITERKMAEDRLTYISMHDIMTGIYNRAFFEEEMHRLSKSRKYPISILVLDMDNLKKINDKHGHLAGDVALQNVAYLVKKCFRSEDVIARIGGDEMAVLLPGMTTEGVLRSRERILSEIAMHNAKDGVKISLSVSIGCATAHQGDLLTDIFKKADTRMYEDKKRKK